MHKIELFSNPSGSASAKDIERDIENFFNNNPNIEIIKIMKYKEHDIMIIYKEKDSTESYPLPEFPRL